MVVLCFLYRTIYIEAVDLYFLSELAYTGILIVGMNSNYEDLKPVNIVLMIAKSSFSLC